MRNIKYTPIGHTILVRKILFSVYCYANIVYCHENIFCTLFLLNLGTVYYRYCATIYSYLCRLYYVQYYICCNVLYTFTLQYNKQINLYVVQRYFSTTVFCLIIRKPCSTVTSISASTSDERRRRRTWGDGSGRVRATRRVGCWPRAPIGKPSGRRRRRYR